MSYKLQISWKLETKQQCWTHDAIISSCAQFSLWAYGTGECALGFGAGAMARWTGAHTALEEGLSQFREPILSGSRL